MDVRQLRYFVAIVEQGSFSRAAGQLNIAQPALSLHVRNMEADLGTPLLFRSPKGVTPTEAGNILLRNARIILDHFAVTEEEIRGHHSDPAGEVRVGLPGTIGEILSVPLIAAAHQRYPRIRLRVSEAMSGFVLEWMREGRIDLAVIYRDISDHGIATTRILEEELLFFGPAGEAGAAGLPPPGTVLDYRQIAGMPLILPGAPHGLRELLARQAAAAGLELNARIEVDSYGNIKELVHAGLGWSILPANALHRDIAAGRLQGWQLGRPPLLRAAHLAHSTSRPMTNAVAVIRDLAAELLRDLVSSGHWAGARLVG